MNPPKTGSDWDRWSFDHIDSHDRIRAAIRSQKKIDLNSYIAYPINPNYMVGFLQANAQLHIDMNGVLGLQSNDLLDVDFNQPNQLDAWVQEHWLEHQDAERALGI